MFIEELFFIEIMQHNEMRHEMQVGERHECKFIVRMFDSHNVGTHRSSFHYLLEGAVQDKAHGTQESCSRVQLHSDGFMSFMSKYHPISNQHIYHSHAFRYSQVHLIRALIPFPIKCSLSFNLNHDQFNKSVICFICMVNLLRCSKMRNDDALRINRHRLGLSVWVCGIIE